MCLSSGQRYEPIRLLLMMVFVLWREFVCGFTLCFVERVHLSIGGTLTALLPAGRTCVLVCLFEAAASSVSGVGIGRATGSPSVNLRTSFTHRPPFVHIHGSRYSHAADRGCALRNTAPATVG